MADISKLEQQADLLMQNVSGWETSTLERIRLQQIENLRRRLKELEGDSNE